MVFWLQSQDEPITFSKKNSHSFLPSKLKSYLRGKKISTKFFKFMFFCEIGEKTLKSVIRIEIQNHRDCLTIEYPYTNVTMKKRKLQLFSFYKTKTIQCNNFNIDDKFEFTFVLRKQCHQFAGVLNRSNGCTQPRTSYHIRPKLKDMLSTCVFSPNNYIPFVSVEKTVEKLSEK